MLLEKMRKTLLLRPAKALHQKDLAPPCLPNLLHEEGLKGLWRTTVRGTIARTTFRIFSVD